MVTITNNLVAFYLSMYNAGTASLLLLIDTPVSKDVFLSTYKMLIADKSIAKIEDLPNDDKIKLVTECRKTGLNFSNETLINASKILHVINFINANS